MDKHISKKLNGYRASHRNRWVVKRDLNLTDPEFVLFEFLLDITDFDTRHDKFGCFEYIPSDIAEVFNVSERTIKRRFKSLLSLKLLKEFDLKRYLYRIPNFQRYVSDIGIKGKATDFVKEEKEHDNSFDIIIRNMTEEKHQGDKPDEKKHINPDRNDVLGSKGIGLSKYASEDDVCLSEEDKSIVESILG